MVGINNPKVGKNNIAQGTGRGADIEWIAGRYQNNPQIVEIAWGGQETILTGGLPRLKNRELLGWSRFLQFIEFV